jgi:hypothetical protein
VLLEFHRKHSTKPNNAFDKRHTTPYQANPGYRPRDQFRPNIQDAAAATTRTLHARGLLSLFLNQIQWNTQVLNTSGHVVIAECFVLPDFQEVNEGMTASKITVVRIKIKIRDD